jgi:hypothetical protein
VNLVDLSWSFTAAVILHNAEEALFLPNWSEQARRWYRPVGKGEFRFAAAVVSLAFVVLTLAASRETASAPVQYLFAGYVAAMLVNAAIPHLLLTIALRQYMPGTITAWLLVVPTGCVYLWNAVQTSAVEVRTLLWVGPLVALCLLATIPVLFLLGRRLFPVRPGISMQRN